MSIRGSLMIGGAVLAASGALYAPAASAATRPPKVDLTMVGSNTTQEVMASVTLKFNASPTAYKLNATATNVYAQPNDPGTVAPSDAACNGGVAITYIQEADPGANQRTAPNGSGAGRTALATSVTNGDSCTSIARSSSPGAASDPAGTQAYAYAVDAVDWATGPGSAAPKNLTMTQIEGVYDCQFTNWDQVGGKNATIDRYFPQNGSGSGTFFTGMLGFDPRITGGVNTCSTPATQIEENEATAISDPVNAVMIYSAGGWIAQANGADKDLRNGFVLRSINNHGTIPVETNGVYAQGPAVAEKNVEPPDYNPTSNTAVQGVRNLFNFINTNSVDYSAASHFVGATSPLCNNVYSSIILKYGFEPLKTCVEQS